MTRGFYVPEPLLKGMRDMLIGKLPEEIGAGIEVSYPDARFVNLWPQSPQLENLTLGGPTLAALTVQITTIDISGDFAREVGSEVRYFFGKDRHGKFLNPITVDGFNILDIVLSDGHSADSGGIPTWVEMATVVYQALGD